jgi:hypothetical protein
MIVRAARVGLKTDYGDSRTVVAGASTEPPLPLLLSDPLPEPLPLDGAS